MHLFRWSAPLALGWALAASAMAQNEPIRAPLGGTTGLNTLYGPTGLIVVPTAYVGPVREVRFGGSWMHRQRGPSLNYGLTDYVEVGGAFIDRDGAGDKAIGNAKLLIIPGNIPWLSLGVGVIDIADSMNQSVYVVGSVDLIPPRVESPTGADAIALRAHVGAGSGIFQDKIFGGAELIFSDRFAFIGEWDSENFNFGLRYKHGDYFQAQIATFDKRVGLQVTTTIRF